jgi:hypothetical protein
VTLTATLFAPDPAFGVEFYDGATLLGTAPVVGATATLQVTTFTAGLHPLSATSLADGRSSALVNLQVNPPEPPPGPTPDLRPPPRVLGVAVEALYPSQASARPGGHATYAFSVFNTGNTNDSYGLSLTSSVFVDSVSAGQIDVVAGTSTIVHVTVTVPEHLGPGTGAPTTLTATSLTDPSIFGSDVVTTTVEPAGGPFVPRQAVSLRPGWNAVGLNVTHLQEVLTNPEVTAVAALGAAGNYTMGPPGVAAFTPTTRGYWVLASAATTLVYQGTLDPEKRAAVAPGWNLLAFPGGAAELRAFADGVPVELSTVIYPELLEIQPDNSYRQASAPVAGRAYWVYGWRAGELRW